MLPIQGSWGGTGTRRLPPKASSIKKVPGIDPSSRADFNKSHIIISEKRDKKAAKYLVKDLPYPYTSQAQFERSMERPLGTEWNTRVGFQRGTLPKVVKKVTGGLILGLIVLSCSLVPTDGSCHRSSGEVVLITIYLSYARSHVSHCSNALKRIL